MVSITKTASYIVILLLFYSNCYADWFIIDPVRQSQTPSKKLTDLDSHLNVNTYRDSDQITWGHESSHGIASRARQLLGNGYNGFYVLNNIGFRVVSPKNFKLSDVATAIPQKYRGDIYQLYMIQQQQYWNNEPEYCLDELVSYTNGTMVGIELGLTQRAEDSFFRALEMNIYAIYMASLAQQKDINEFTRWITYRNLLIYKALPKQNPKVVRNYQYLKEVMNEK